MKRLKLACFVLALLTPIGVRASEDPETAFSHESELLLLAHHFDVLDANAVQFRRTAARLPGGRSKLYYFYRSLAAFKGGGCSCDPYQTAVPRALKGQAIGAWFAQRPQSTVAHIAMAQFLINEAWVARGSQYADKVTDDQWSLFRSYLAKAESLLTAVPPADDPYVYVGLMDTAGRAFHARPRLDALFAQAVKKFPEFFHYYALRADTLQSKWYGGPGELADYLRSLLHNPGGDDGEIAYSFAAGRVAALDLYPSHLLYRDTGLSWPEVKKAYAVRERHYGLTMRDWNRLLFFAVAANDSHASAEIIGHIGTVWNKDLWWSEQDYAAVVKWAQFYAASPKAANK